MNFFIDNFFELLQKITINDSPEFCVTVKTTLILDSVQWRVIRSVLIENRDSCVVMATGIVSLFNFSVSWLCGICSLYESHVTVCMIHSW